MPNVDAKASKECVILPFNPKGASDTQLQTTSLAALIAVTVMHEPGVSAEEKLMEIIERSGEVEILDADEAYADLGLEELDAETGRKLPEPINDNAAFELI